MIKIWIRKDGVSMTKFQKYIILLSGAFEKIFGYKSHSDKEMRNLMIEVLK